ncbi:hypothetical protein KKB55_13815 [Myxococcota bacterium]|nr:hypothetical protein [Myxococcota bacterium]
MSYTKDVDIPCELSDFEAWIIQTLRKEGIGGLLITLSEDLTEEGIGPDGAISAYKIIEILGNHFIKNSKIIKKVIFDLADCQED